MADLERALGFWCGVLGFELMQRFGPQAAFVSAGGYHHHIGLNTWESRGGAPPARGTTGLYHVAILYPSRAALADALRRLIGAGIELDGAADHGVSEALYLRDPDGNGVELYVDRPPAEWPRDRAGNLAMVTEPLDLERLLAEAGRDLKPDALDYRLRLAPERGGGESGVGDAGVVKKSSREGPVDRSLAGWRRRRQASETGGL